MLNIDPFRTVVALRFFCGFFCGGIFPILNKTLKQWTNPNELYFIIILMAIGGHVCIRQIEIIFYTNE